jgi:hypothetical protein
VLALIFVAAAMLGALDMAMPHWYVARPLLILAAAPGGHRAVDLAVAWSTIQMEKHERPFPASRKGL